LAKVLSMIPCFVSKCFARISRSNMTQQIGVQVNLYFHREILARNNSLGKSGKAFGD
jgi:hypothetical protein